MQTVVIVNGSAGLVHFVETVLHEGHYDAVFVESTAHAYSQIKRIHPNLVVLCLSFEDDEAFQVLSMLKSDEETAKIPLLLCARARRRPDGDQGVQDLVESEAAGAAPTPLMN